MVKKTVDRVQAVTWKNDALLLLDQRLLPDEEVSLRFTNSADVSTAIAEMVVRGAPAIGIAAAFGVALAARESWAEAGARWREVITARLQVLRDARPTAINLAWAIDTLSGYFDQIEGDPEPALVAKAQQILDSDIAANRAMGELGAAVLDHCDGVLTHCNAGALATGGYGTALGVIRSAWAQRRIQSVYADETRPWMQGARLTAWELIHDGVPVTLLVEGAAATLMAQGKVQWVITGADRIAANGDVANKIGTYSLAVLARAHGVKFMVAAPMSTIDWEMPNGAQIPIEQRDAAELLQVAGQRFAAPGASAWNPVFDVTPANLIDCIVTEDGVVHQPDTERMASLLS